MDHWINAVIIIEQPLEESAVAREELAAQFAQQFSSDPNLLVSITVAARGLRAKIQQPLDLDLSASDTERQAAARQCAAQLAYNSKYYWEEVDERGELHSQGQKESFDRDE